MYKFQFGCLHGSWKMSYGDPSFRDPQSLYCDHSPSVPWEKSGDGYRNVSLCSICLNPLNLHFKVQYSDHCKANVVLCTKTVFSDPQLFPPSLAVTTTDIHTLNT